MHLNPELENSDILNLELFSRTANFVMWKGKVSKKNTYLHLYQTGFSQQKQKHDFYFTWGMI